MKAHVNLLAPDLLGGERFLFQKVALPGAYFLLITAILAGIAVEVGKSKLLKKEIASLNERRVQTAESLAGLQSVFRQGTAAREADEAKDQFMKQLDQERIRWSSLLQEMSALIPEKIWLNAMEGLEDLQGGKITGIAQTEKEVKFVGFANSHTAIAELMSALERSQYVENVMLVHAEKTPEAGQIKVTFEIKVVLKHGGING
ncbi:MAG: PilN domain-containing protein [Nitrospiria bacterium]